MKKVRKSTRQTVPKRMVSTGKSTDTKVKKDIPEDVREALNLLYSMRHELPDTMLEPIRDIVENYRDDIHEWDKTGKKPDWDYYRNAINEICDDDGMPHLCEVPKSSRMMKKKSPVKGMLRRKTIRKSPRKVSCKTWRENCTKCGFPLREGMDYLYRLADRRSEKDPGPIAGHECPNCGDEEIYVR